MSNSKIFVVLCALIVAGCAQMAVDKRLDEFKATLNPMIGHATKEDVLHKFGVPRT